MPTEDPTRTEHHHRGSTPVALADVVSNPDGVPSQLSLSLPKHMDLLQNPSDSSRFTKASRLQSIRKQHAATGVSEQASELLLVGYSTGTNTAYQSGWVRWSCWCSEWEIDAAFNPV